MIVAEVHPRRCGDVETKACIIEGVSSRSFAILASLVFQLPCFEADSGTMPGHDESSSHQVEFCRFQE